MSLQDDVFDVAAALEGKPEAEAFDNITKRLWKYEADLEISEQNWNEVTRALAIIGTLMMQKIPPKN